MLREKSGDVTNEGRSKGKDKIDVNNNNYC